MPIQKLVEYLDQQDVKYVVITHSRAFTMQEIAAATHIPGKELAKTVVVAMLGRLQQRRPVDARRACEEVVRGRALLRDPVAQHQHIVREHAHQ